MKNIKRILLIVALIVLAVKVFSNDIEKTKNNENSEITITKY